MEIICINCPLGCVMNVTKQGDDFIVLGHSCPRGKTYAIKECTRPTRIITSSLYVENGLYPVVSVKTNQDIPKEKIFEILNYLKSIKPQAPIRIGDVIVENILNTGACIVATKNVPQI